MTPRAPKLCGEPTCGSPVPAGQRYCQDHEPQAWSTAPKRNHIDSRSHDAKWKKTVKRIHKRDNHRCQIRFVGICTGIASEVDHRIPVTRGGSDEDSNLQSACRPCHLAKSSDEGHEAQGHKPKGRIRYVPYELRGLPR